MRDSGLFSRRIPTAVGRAAMAITVCFVFAGCASKDLSCDDVEAYERAQGGARIDAPDDLDELEASKEMRVAHASPRDPRPEGSPCLDLPPALEVVK